MFVKENIKVNSSFIERGETMKTQKCLIVVALMSTAVLLMTGCSSGTDESKPISEVKAEAEKMDVKQLKQMALKYKEKIVIPLNGWDVSSVEKGWGWVTRFGTTMEYVNTGNVNAGTARENG